jgi:hypothetical protein
MLQKHYSILRKKRAAICYFFLSGSTALSQRVAVEMTQKHEITQKKQRFTEQCDARVEGPGTRAICI